MCELSEFTEIYPNKNWKVGKDFDEYKIIYEEEEFTYIDYINSNKTLYFIKLSMVLHLLVIEEN